MGDEPSASRGRIASLDQFRGYTVAGMLLVNVVGGLGAFHPIFKHHNTYCSYADTIMPQFFFAVGFSYRLTFLRRLAELGRRAASLAVVRRALGLILVGFLLYHLDGKVKTWDELRSLGFWGFLTTAFRRELCQTLVQIAITSWFYLDYAWKTPVIDGGWLGILSWAIPMLAGTLAYDAIAARDASGRPRASAVPTLMAWGAVMMLAGYGLASMRGLAAPPFTPPAEGYVVDLWTMSQRTGSVSYMTFAAGVSLAVYALFVVACDALGWSVGLFRTFGTNALAAYILHGMVASAVRPYLPRDAPLWYAIAGTLLYFAICWGLIRHLEKNRIFLKL
ncbi:hypothetical protein HK102_009480 [Quaeritorhiza haematococci]|nr:hypothetical protein HK102_009480 [Quaeritorhiza haematococci]